MQTYSRPAAVAERSARTQLDVAALGTFITLVEFTAPIATLNRTAAALGAAVRGPAADRAAVPYRLAAAGRADRMAGKPPGLGLPGP